MKAKCSCLADRLCKPHLKVLLSRGFQLFNKGAKRRSDSAGEDRGAVSRHGLKFSQCNQEISGVHFLIVQASVMRSKSGQVKPSPKKEKSWSQAFPEQSWRSNSMTGYGCGRPTVAGCGWMWSPSGILRSLVVTIYRELFQSIVDEMNQTLQLSAKNHSDEVGILDMYGFENLETNGLEQNLSCTCILCYIYIYIIFACI